MHSSEMAHRELESLLDFFLSSGVDSCLEEDAVNRFELSQQLAEQAKQARMLAPSSVQMKTPEQSAPGEPAGLSGHQKSGFTPSAPRSADPVIPDGAVIDTAREMAKNAGSLDELKNCLQSFNGCNLRLSAKNLVFADGRAGSSLMLIGEAPGRDEDLAGLPFVGRSGRLLDVMLQAIGMDRSQAYITNVVPWRPPGNRTPTPQETEICKPFIVRQIELVKPEVLVFLGAASAKCLLGTQEGIRRMRGRWGAYAAGERQIPCLATYHPAYLLRSPLEKRLSWRDFLSVKQKLEERAGAQTIDKSI